MPARTLLPLLFLLLFLLPGLAAAQVPVRVLLDEVETVTVAMDSWHRGFVDGAARFETELPLSWPLRAEGSRLLVDGQPVGRTLRFETASGLVSYGGTTYRGALAFTARDSAILVLNTVDIEDYLRGVVPSEMQASWPQEALRAQAIAARSYVLSSLSQQGDYDVCATQDCQVYSGTEREHPATDAAVAATRGLVLTWNGAFARTYYHADSGGMVASSAEVWGEDRPYLPALADVPADTPHRSWTLSIRAASLAAELNAAGLTVGTPHGIEILSRTSSGRAASVRITGSSGTAALEGTQLTRVLRALGLKSTRFSVTGGLTVRGDGWGHGVGMSQYGAMSMARSGYGHAEILAFYYPGTNLARFSVSGRAD